MNKTHLFYATRDDLLVIIKEIEAATALKYVPFGRMGKLPQSFNSASEIPNLGIASHSSAVACEKFLVYKPEVTIKPRKIETSNEEIIIDQLLNPDTITFSAGGLWNDEILLNGSIGTVSQSESAKILVKEFQKVLKKQFTKVRAFYVGPQALELLKNGKRLTISEQSPQEFNLLFL